jgi:hypothetical protein
VVHPGSPGGSRTVPRPGLAQIGADMCAACRRNSASQLYFPTPLRDLMIDPTNQVCCAGITHMPLRQGFQ